MLNLTLYRTPLFLLAILQGPQSVNVSEESVIHFTCTSSPDTLILAWVIDGSDAMLSGGQDSVAEDPVSGILSSNLTITASKGLNNSLISCVAVALFSPPVNSSALLLIQGMDEWMDE